MREEPIPIRGSTMTIGCTLCPFLARSLDILPEKALEDVGNKLANHMAERHREAIILLNQNGVKVGMLGMWLMLMNLYARIPEEETYFLKIKDEREAEFMSLMGFDVEPEVKDITEDKEVSSEAD